MTEPAPQPAAKTRPTGSSARRLMVVAMIVAGIAGLGALARYGPLTPVGQSLVESLVDGVKIGRLGHLTIAGLRGDVWRRFTIGRLAIVDGKGAWLRVRNLTVQWRWPELVGRRVHLDLLTAETVSIDRRPILGPEEAPTSPPVSLQVDAVRARLAMAPAFAFRRGLYDMRGAVRMDRSGGAAGMASAESLLHPGDHLHLRFDVGAASAFAVTADVLEAEGGALAGMLGLAADRPFRLNLAARGSARAGAFTIASRIGAVEPIGGAGAWNQAGGSADVRVVLAASTLVARYEKIIGPELHLRVAGARAADGFYGLNLRADGQNAVIAAVGEADIGRGVTGPRGMAADVRFADTSGLIGWPQTGPLHLAGRLDGRAGSWNFVGAGDLLRASEGAYSLAELKGPVRLAWKTGELSIKAAAQGSGGAGHGLVAALLGARPAATAEMVRFSDGRLLIRQLDVVAPGLKVTASGERDIFGALTFRGKGDVSNLTVAHAGAAGLVSAEWTAGQSQRGVPWSFSFDAKGARFTSGWSEVDRLLGAGPRLAARGTYQAGVFSVAQSTLEGAAGALNSAGAIGPAGGLNLNLAWRATGPFRIGPLEITGAAKGGGTLAGTVSNPRADLSANFAALDVPYLPLRAAHVALSFVGGDPGGADGRIAVTADSDHGPAKGAAAFRLAPGGLDLSAIDVSAGGARATGDLVLRGGGASRADLKIAVGAGAFLAEGVASGRVRIVDAPGGAHAKVELDVVNAVPSGGGTAIKSFNIAADGPVSRLPYRAAGEGVSQSGPWRVAGAGTFETGSAGETLTFDGGGRLSRAEFRTRAPAVFHFGAKASDAKMALLLGGGHADIAVSQAEGYLTGKATLTDVDLALLNRDFTGRFNADLSLAGRGDNLTGDLEARLSGAGGRDLKGGPPVDGTVTAHLGAGALRLEAAVSNAQGLKARADVSLPAEASAAPFRIALDPQRPMHGAFSIDGELGPVWDLLMGADRSLSGQVTASGTLGGTLADPRAIGTASLKDGRFHDASTGLKLTGLTLDARLADTNVDIGRMSGADAATGQVAGAGRISLARGGVSTFRLDLTGFRLIDNDMAQAVATGRLTANRGADGRVKLSGSLNIDRAQIAARPPIATGVVPMDVVEIHKPFDIDQRFTVSPGGAAPVDLDVDLKSPGRIFLKGRGLDLELSLDAHVGGTTVASSLGGIARVVRGDYDFAGQRFQIDDRGVIVLAATPEAIRLDLTATREDPTITAVIRIQGTAAKPKITLTSTPVLPTDEVLSQVLFGVSASGLSPVEGAQLASALSTLAGGGGFDVLGGLRDFAHLDRLAFAGNALTGNTIAGGKYLRENLYLELTGSDRQGAAAQLEWRARKHLSLISRLGTVEGDSSLLVRWRKDY